MPAALASAATNVPPSCTVILGVPLVILYAEDSAQADAAWLTLAKAGRRLRDDASACAPPPYDCRLVMVGSIHYTVPPQSSVVLALSVLSSGAVHHFLDSAMTGASSITVTDVRLVASSAATCGMTARAVPTARLRSRRRLGNGCGVGRRRGPRRLRLLVRVYNYASSTRLCSPSLAHGCFWAWEDLPRAPRRGCPMSTSR